jgi:arylsulfatase A-like enzyme
MFFSDHGDQLGSHGRFGKCVPYEESIRIPFLIGGGLPLSYNGRRSGNAPCLINHVDIAPTTLGLCGLEVPEEMEGFDYSHRRTGVRFEERAAREPDSAYLQLIGDRESGYAWRSLVTRDGWKYACVAGGEWLMFNLAEDPFEQNNLAFHTHFKGRRDELRNRLRAWAERIGDRFPFPGG